MNRTVSFYFCVTDNPSSLPRPPAPPRPAPPPPPPSPVLFKFLYARCRRTCVLLSHTCKELHKRQQCLCSGDRIQCPSVVGRQFSFCRHTEVNVWVPEQQKWSRAPGFECCPGGLAMTTTCKTAVSAFGSQNVPENNFFFGGGGVWQELIICFSLSQCQGYRNFSVVYGRIYWIFLGTLTCLPNFFSCVLFCAKINSVSLLDL